MKRSNLLPVKSDDSLDSIFRGHFYSDLTQPDVKKEKDAHFVFGITPGLEIALNL